MKTLEWFVAQLEASKKREDSLIAQNKWLLDKLLEVKDSYDTLRVEYPVKKEKDVPVEVVTEESVVAVEDETKPLDN